MNNKGAITGLAITKQGIPIAGAGVVIVGESPEHRDIGALTNNEGRYRFDNLLPGNYSILVISEEYGKQTKSVQVTADEDSVLNFYFG